MEVKIEYLKDNQTEFLVDYGAKRKCHFAMPYVGMTDEQFDYLYGAMRITIEETDKSALRKMSDASYFKLIEHFTVTYCYAYSPKASCGLQKKYIRHAILQGLNRLAEGSQDDKSPQVLRLTDPSAK
ncbi:MAG: hypothetical protein ACQEU4_07585 [Bacillota bacterium]